MAVIVSLMGKMKKISHQDTNITLKMINPYSCHFQDWEVSGCCQVSSVIRSNTGPANLVVGCKYFPPLVIVSTNCAILLLEVFSGRMISGVTQHEREKAMPI